MNTCKSKPPRPDLLLVSFMPTFWHNVANTSGGTHQDWPQRAVSLWLRLEVQAVLFALTNTIDSKRGPLALSCIRQHGEDRYSYVVNAVHQASPS